MYPYLPDLLILYVIALWKLRGWIPRMLRRREKKRRENAQHIAFMQNLTKTSPKVKSKNTVVSCTDPACPCVNHKQKELVNVY